MNILIFFVLFNSFVHLLLSGAEFGTPPELDGPLTTSKIQERIRSKLGRCLC